MTMTATAAAGVTNFFFDSTSRPVVPMKLASNGHLIDRAYREALHYQFDRELAMNSLQSGASKVSIEVDWVYMRATADLYGEDNRVYRYLIADDGPGMTGTELLAFFNQLSSSGHVIGDHLNFGCGAKVTTLPWNGHGVIVMSWSKQDPTGSMIRIRRDTTTGEYGLHEWSTEGDSSEPVIEPLPEYHDLLQEVLGETETGTLVILMGEGPDQDTFLGPKHDSVKVHTRTLNTRFWVLPPKVKVTALGVRSASKNGKREGKPDTIPWPSSHSQCKGETGGVLRRVTGARHFYEKYHTQKGSVQLTDATAHWYYFEGDAKKKLDNIHSYAAVSGIVGVTHRDPLSGAEELYNVVRVRKTRNAKAAHRFRQFGILYGTIQSNLVLVVEPSTSSDSKEGVYPNSVRSELLHSGTPDRKLPWGRWGGEFFFQMPDFLKELAEGAGFGGNEKDVLDRIYGDARQLLQDRDQTPSAVGPNGVSFAPGSDNGNGNGHSDGPQRQPVCPGLQQPGTVKPRKGKPRGSRGRTLPLIDFNGQDRDSFPARYYPDTNTIEVFWSHDWFRGQIAFWDSYWNNQPGALPKIKAVVKEVLGLSLVVHVAVANILRPKEEWSYASYNAMVSPEALASHIAVEFHTGFNTASKIKNRLKNVLGPRH